MFSVFSINSPPGTITELIEDYTAERAMPGSWIAVLMTATIDLEVNLLRNVAFRTAHGSTKLCTAHGFPVAVDAKLRAAVPTWLIGSPALNGLPR